MSKMSKQAKIDVRDSVNLIDNLSNTSMLTKDELNMIEKSILLVYKQGVIDGLKMTSKKLRGDL